MRPTSNYQSISKLGSLKAWAQSGRDATTIFTAILIF